MAKCDGSFPLSVFMVLHHLHHLQDLRCDSMIDLEVLPVVINDAQITKVRAVM